MNPMDEQIEAAMSILRANGAIVDIDPGTPEHVKRAFLEMILKCPKSRAAVLGKHDGREN